MRLKIILLNIFLISFFLINIKESSAQKFMLNATLDKNQVAIGDTLNLSLELEQPQNFKVTSSQYKKGDAISENTEIREIYKSDTVTKGNQWIITQKIKIQTFDIDTIPPFLYFFERNGEIDTLFSNELTIGILAPEAPKDTTQAIHPIYGTIEKPMTFGEMLPYILGILGGLLLVGLILYYVRKMKKVDETDKPQKPKEPAHIIALRDLDLLKKEELWQNNELKKFHSQLTEIVRVYIEDRFKIPAMEQTSYEILQDFKKKKELEAESKLWLETVLTTADFVKFAKAKPLPDENEKSLIYAYQFIEKTKNEIVVEPEIQPSEEIKQ